MKLGATSSPALDVSAAAEKARPGGSDPAKASAPANANASTPSASAQAQSASVTVSTSSSTLALAASGPTSDIDQAKVTAVRSAIANGSYKVNAGAIADKMLSNAQEVLQRQSTH